MSSSRARLPVGLLGWARKMIFERSSRAKLDALHVQIEVLVAGHLNDLRAHQVGGEAVHAEGGRGLDYFISFADEEADYQVYEFVAAIAADDGFRGGAGVFR